MLICDFSILNKYGKLLLDEMLVPLNVNWRELVVLLVLDWSPGCNQSYLFEYLQTDKGNVTKLIKRMDEAGFIIRKVDPHDKRKRKLYLDKKGRDLIPALKDVLEQWEEKCCDCLNNEQKELYKQLNKIVVDQFLKMIQPIEKDGEK
jgi:DNA-binding MarR family transcriptional regulator